MRCTKIVTMTVVSDNDIIHQSSDIKYDKGFIYVASLNPMYYEFSLLSAQSLRDYHSEANITLFTHQDFVDERAEKLFDEIRVGIPHSPRAKMWCMARTPYDVTLYNDVDSYIRRRKIRKVFDQLGQNDMMFGTNLLYTVAKEELCYADKNHEHEITHHGSLCLYHKTDLNLDFHQTWYDEYMKQLTTPWEHDWADSVWKKYDMHTLWRLINNFDSNFDKFEKINIGLLGRHWNNTFVDRKQDLKEPPVITQLNRYFINTIKNQKELINKNIEFYGKKKKSTNSGEFS